jgi:hypothetical protein
LPVVRTWMAGFFLATLTVTIPVMAVIDSGKIHINTNHPYITHGDHLHATS